MLKEVLEIDGLRHQTDMWIYTKEQWKWYKLKVNINSFSYLQLLWKIIISKGTGSNELCVDSFMRVFQKVKKMDLKCLFVHEFYDVLTYNSKMCDNKCTKNAS